VLFYPGKVLVRDIEGIELIAVEGKFDAGVARPVHHVNGVQKIQVGQPEGAVGELDHGICSILNNPA
jgi:hypothetical protein